MAKVYIAGKIKGLPAKNTRLKFINASISIFSKGHTPINPFGFIEEYNKSIIKSGGMPLSDDDPQQRKEILKICTDLLMGCDYIYLLNDWKDSEGATFEKQVADFLTYLFTMVELIIRVGQGLAIVFLFGLIMDYPVQRRKTKERRLQQLKDDCKSGKHKFMGWHYDYTIGYNDKDVYRRRCNHCHYNQFTISRLHPLDAGVHTFDKLTN